MPDNTRKRSRYTASKGTTRGKGDIVEQVIASMHQVAGVKVERNVFLPARDGSGRMREIDVLLTSQVAGYPVRVAIECKNEDKPIGVGKIDEFIGKLHDVDIPTQQSIFVSSSRYTSGAINRAQKAGIEPLILRNLTETLPKSLREAFQSLIYLSLEITEVRVDNDDSGPAHPADILHFRNDSGDICGGVADLVWQEWISGKITEKIGVRRLILKKPDDWLQIVNGRIAQVYKIEADVRITGHIVTLLGLVSHHALVKPINMELRKEELKATFNILPGAYPVTTFTTERELRKFMKKNIGINVYIGRFRLPRIKWMTMFWPPSEKSIRKIVGLIQQAIADRRPLDPQILASANIEGTDMKTAWDRIWNEHPSLKWPKS